jgi:hypothetical protein
MSGGLLRYSGIRTGITVLQPSFVDEYCADTDAKRHAEDDGGGKRTAADVVECHWALRSKTVLGGYRRAR